MKLTKHAIDRFQQRINKDFYNARATRTLKKLYEANKDISEDQVESLSIIPRKGTRYKIGRLGNGKEFIMVIRGKTIVTVLEKPEIVYIGNLKVTIIKKRR